jgi:glucose uptake protein GlcU
LHGAAIADGYQPSRQRSGSGTVPASRRFGGRQQGRTMFALHAAVSAAHPASSGLVLTAIIASLLLAFWRTALKLVLAMAAVAITVLLASGTVAILSYVHLR